MTLKGYTFLKWLNYDSVKTGEYHSSQIAVLLVTMTKLPT